MTRVHLIESLPAWAQDKIRYLTRALESAQAELVKRDANKPTHIVVDHYSSTPIYIDDKEEVTFLFDKEEYISVRFARDQDGKHIGVNVMASAFRDRLGFFPSSGNTGVLLLVPDTR